MGDADVLVSRDDVFDFAQTLLDYPRSYGHPAGACDRTSSAVAGALGPTFRRSRSRVGDSEGSLGGLLVGCDRYTQELEERALEL